MGCFGPDNMGEAMRDIEIGQWQYPRDLEGTVVQSLEELTKKVPRDKHLAEPALIGKSKGMVGNDYTVYVRPWRKNGTFDASYLKLAYGCGTCKNIVIGPPNIETANHGCTGWELSYTCRQCGVLLDPDIKRQA